MNKKETLKLLTKESAGSRMKRVAASILAYIVGLSAFTDKITFGEFADLFVGPGGPYVIAGMLGVILAASSTGQDA